MRHVRRALIGALAGAAIVGAYYAGSLTAGLLVASAHGIAPAQAPVSIEIAERIA